MRHFLSRPESLLVLVLPFVALSIAMPRTTAFGPGVAGLLILGFALFSGQRPLFKKDVGLWIVAALLPVLVALSALWGDDKSFILERSVKLIGIVFPAVLFISVLSAQQWTEKSLHNFYKAFYIVFCLSTLFILIENEAGQPISTYIRSHLFGAEVTKDVQYNRSLVILSLLYLPVIVGLQNLCKGKRQLFHILVATACLVAALLSTKSQTAQLCFLTAALFYFASPYIKLKGIPFLSAIAVICMLAAPFAVMEMYKFLPENEDDVPALIMEASIPHRLEVWNFAATETMKSPWVGHGVEAMRNMISEHWMKYPNSNQILHPHNAPMQVWLEFGLFGALVTCVFFVWLTKRICALQGQRRRLALSLSVSALLVLSVGYGLWQSWQIGLLFLLPALTILCTNQSHETESKS